MKVTLFTFLFIFQFFKWYLNLEKYIKLDFLIKYQKLCAFSQNLNSVNAKKKKMLLFSDRRKYVIQIAVAAALAIVYQNKVK